MQGADPKSSVICLSRLPLRTPWEAFLARVSGFPIPSRELRPLQYFIRQLSASVAREFHLNIELFLQLAQLHLGDGEVRFPKYAREWIPETGLGVWPDRDPPTLWTMEEVERTKPGERLRQLMHLVFRVTTSVQEREAARDIMLDLGPVVQILTQEDTQSLLNTAREVLLPSIQHASFRGFPFYLPLLECKSLKAATPEQLVKWFCGATVYIRESFEDQGILIASREPLASILEELGGRFEQEPEPVWRIPI